MDCCSEQTSVFLALRVRSESSELTEVFMASAPGMTYKGLPVCVLADGESIATELGAVHIADTLGPPTHYYLGSTDECWLLDAGKFARFKAALRQARSIGANLAQSPRGGWLAPLQHAMSSAEGLTDPAISQNRLGGAVTQLNLW
jgi:hypothetical protein